MLSWLAAALPLSAAWQLVEGPHPSQSGQVVDFMDSDELVARFVHGQDAEVDGNSVKPYLHIMDGSGKPLTKGEAVPTYPHHRGLFVGWDDVESPLAKDYDFWHLDNGGTMEVVEIEEMTVSESDARITARIEWRGDGALVLTERRTLAVSRPADQAVRVDAWFEFTAPFQVKLKFSNHHGGVSFRAAEEVFARQNECSYLWQPPAAASANDIVTTAGLEWIRFHFPIGNGWHAAHLFNAPANPVQRAQLRRYGRFDFAGTKTIQEAGERLVLCHRYLIESAEAPAGEGALSPEQAAAARSRAEAYHQEFLDFLASDVDGDGQSHADEMDAATDPYDASDVFRVQRVETTGNSFTLRFPWQPGRTYRVWRTDGSDDWGEIDSPSFTTPETGFREWTEMMPVPPGRRFYRLSVTAP